MLELFGLADHTVQIGISNLAFQNRHGVATTRNGRIPFIADRPGKLKRARESTVLSIFQQFEKLGAPASEVELSVGSRRRVFRIENGRLRMTSMA